MMMTQPQNQRKIPRIIDMMMTQSQNLRKIQRIIDFPLQVQDQLSPVMTYIRVQAEQIMKKTLLMMNRRGTVHQRTQEMTLTLALMMRKLPIKMTTPKFYPMLVQGSNLETQKQTSYRRLRS